MVHERVLKIVPGPLVPRIEGEKRVHDCVHKVAFFKKNVYTNKLDKNIYFLDNVLKMSYELSFFESGQCPFNVLCW